MPYLIMAYTQGTGTSFDDTFFDNTPIVQYKLDEVSGNFADSSGNGYTATVSGSPTYGVTSPLAEGTAVNFGASPYATNNSVATALKNVSSSDFINVLIYFRTSDTTGSDWTNVMLSMNGNSGNTNIMRFGVRPSDGAIFFTLDDPNRNHGSGYNDGQWHTLAASWRRDGGATASRVLFVDGVDVYANAGTPSWSQADRFTVAGEWDGGSMSDQFNGDLDNIFIGSRSTPWTAQEALDLMP